MDEMPSTRPSLLVRLRDPRDEQAWGEFEQIYAPLVHRLARRSGLQDADADDLVQEVLRTVAGAIDGWDPDPARGSFRGWLFRIARNLMINLMTRQKSLASGSGDTGLRILLESHPAPSGGDSAAFDDEYRSRVLAWAAEQVRGEFTALAWQVFWAAGVEGKSAGVVARELNVTVGTVYQYKSRIMARLRQKIGQAEGER
ncbi:RNA polymerase sigma factor [Singulisphaera sp. PoT]|uniref:RNA polymerase sigma factor n=1 Tax=Singulisphaera sp. PoT TaxID=3411797 RepID=UPI003BF4DCFD